MKFFKCYVPHNSHGKAVDSLKEAQYLKYLVQDKKIPPYEVAEMFQMKVEEVERILVKAIPNREARKIISDNEMYEYGKPILGKILEIIASAPMDKQPILKKAVVKGKLKPNEAEAAKEAMLQGASKEAIQIAKSAGKPREKA